MQHAFKKLGSSEHVHVSSQPDSVLAFSLLVEFLGVFVSGVGGLVVTVVAAALGKTDASASAVVSFLMQQHSIPS